MFRILMAVIFTLNTPFAFGAAKLQNEDFKSLSQITAAGGTKANLLNDTKVYITANGINDQLSTAITSGLLGGGGDGGVNLLSGANNPDFESGYNTVWTNTGGTYADATGSDILFGGKSAVFTATATGQFVRSALVTVTNGLAGKSCMAQVYYKGGDGNLTLKLLDGSGNTLASRAFVAASAATPLQIPFGCGAQGQTYRLSVESTAAAAKVALDRTKIGEYGFGQFTDVIPIKITPLNSQVSAQFVPQPNTRWMRVVAIGAGGGGGGGGNSGGGTGGAGTATLFGGVINMGGGAGGTARSAGSPGYGGAATTFTQSSNVYGFAFPGNAGQFAGAATSGGFTAGGMGGAGPLGGGGYAGVSNTVGGAAGGGNTGSGGGGGGSTAVASGSGGGGGGAGAMVDAVFSAPLAASYTYQVGIGGAAGGAGASGSGGGNGNDGIVIVYEYGYAGGMAFQPSGGGLSAGEIIAGAWNTCPTGTIAADGAALSRSVYRPLFLAIGTTYGAGDGTTTFNAPNLNGIFARGAGSQTIAGMAYSATLGTYSNDYFQNHSHSENEGVTTQNINFAAGGSNLFTKTVGAGTSVNNANQNGSPISWAGYPLRTGPETQPANVGVKYCVRTIDANPMPVLVGPFAQMPSGAITAATYSILPTDEIVDVDSTSNAIVLTLPTAVGVRGKRIIITKTNQASVNAVTLQTTASQTLGFAGTTSTKLLDQGEAVEVVSDGVNWKYLRGAIREINFNFTQTAGGCTTTNLAGSGINTCSFSATGASSFGFASGTFSQLPTCIVNNVSPGSYGAQCRIESPSVGGVALVCSNNNAASNQAGYGNCSGYR